MAKTGKNGQWELSVEQLNAIDALVLGKSDQEVGVLIGRTRQTVQLWRSLHPDFRAELNRRRAEVWAAAADKLRSLLPLALDVLEQELTGGTNRLKAAIAIMRLAGIPLADIGSQDCDSIVAQEASRRQDTLLLSLTGNLAQVHQELIAKCNDKNQ